MDSDALSQVYTQFCRTEIKLKSLEYHLAELAMPSVNELRYAAFHILRAMQAEGLFELVNAPDGTDPRELLADGICPSGEAVDEPPDAENELRRAKSHCGRAYYDIVQIEVIDKAELVREYEKKYSIGLIQRVIEGYSSLSDAIRNAHDRMAEVNEKYYLSREKYCQELQDAAKPILDAYKALRDNEGGLDEALEEKMERALAVFEEKKKGNRNFVIKVMTLFFVGLTFVFGSGKLLDAMVSSPEGCVPGDQKACKCEDFSEGYLVCAEGGNEWSECSCVKKKPATSNDKSARTDRVGPADKRERSLPGEEG